MAFLGVFWYQSKKFILKKYPKRKQIELSGFVKLSVRWAEWDRGDQFGGANWESWEQDSWITNRLTSVKLNRLTNLKRNNTKTLLALESYNRNNFYCM